ncbi:MAG: hypothetical protein AAF740_03765 [Bacteroidota bacterium]
MREQFISKNPTIEQVSSRLQVIVQEINHLQKKSLISKKFSVKVNVPKMYVNDLLAERLKALRKEQDELSALSVSLFRQF